MKPKWLLKIRCNTPTPSCEWDGEPCKRCAKIEVAVNSVLKAYRAVLDLIDD